MITIVKQFGL